MKVSKLKKKVSIAYKEERMDYNASLSTRLKFMRDKMDITRHWKKQIKKKDSMLDF